MLTEFYYKEWIFLKAAGFSSGVQTFFFSFLDADHLESFMGYKISFMDERVAFKTKRYSSSSAEGFGNDVVFAFGRLTAFKALHRESF